MYYFAYGSNMLRERLAARVGDTGCIGPARLAGYRVDFTKLSRDGSGKCTLVAQPGEHGVWGVVFEMTGEQKTLLDGFEGKGYKVETVYPVASGETIWAFTYIAMQQSLDASLRPYSWYRDLVLAGALQAQLPAGYIDRIEAIPTITDHDAGRVSENLNLIRSSI